MRLTHTIRTCILLQIQAAALIALSGCASLTEQSTDAGNMPAPPDPLAGINWTAEQIFDRDAKAAKSTMMINADGTVNGNTACNNYRGSVERDGNNISFGMLASTRMMCEPAVSGQETVFLEALGEARSWSQADNQLNLLDENGAPVLKFGRNGD